MGQIIVTATHKNSMNSQLTKSNLNTFIPASLILLKFVPL